MTKKVSVKKNRKTKNNKQKKKERRVKCSDKTNWLRMN